MEEENKVLETETNQENNQTPSTDSEAANKETPVETTPVEEEKVEAAVEETKVETPAEAKEEVKAEEVKEEKASDKEAETKKGKASKETKAENKEEKGEEGKTSEEAQKGGKRPPRNFKPRKEEKEFTERVVKINRISKTVKGGKRMRFSALVVIGDSKGRYGFGMGKSIETPEAIKKAIASAKKQLKKVEIVEGDTIAHEIVGKFGATQVYLKPAPEGTGLVAGGAVRAILELAGIKNIYSKIYGSRTQMNVVKATVSGLTGLKSYTKVKQIRYNK